ncbi:MAG: hypothetical protein ACRC7H_10935 [Plesiomonas shigelloides]
MKVRESLVMYDKMKLKTSTLTSSPLPISAGPSTPAPTAERVSSHHSSVPEPLVTSQSDLFTRLVLMDIEDEDEVHIISPFVLNDTRQRRPKPMREKQLMFCWVEENKERLESKRSAKKLNNAKETDHEGKRKCMRCDKSALC